MCGWRGGQRIIWHLQVNKVWVHEGRFYNYAKPGAVEYSSTQGAQAAQKAAKAAADAIHGLGRVRRANPCVTLDILCLSRL